MSKFKAKSSSGKWSFRIRHRIMTVAVLLTLGCANAPARGDEVTKLRDDWDVTLGGGFRYGPAYESGRSYRLEPVPYFDAEWYDANGYERAFISTEDGVGFDALSTDHWKLGPYLFWRPGRRTGSSSALSGLDDSHNSLQAGAFVEYDPNECCDVFVKARRDVGGTDHGVFFDIGGEVNAPIAPRHWFAGFKLTTTWANGPGLQPLFGITPSQSARTGLATYTPSHGFKDVEAEPSITYQFDNHWAIQSFATYERLLDTVTDSPLVRERGTADQLSVGLLLLYHF
jgi:MipA family protein